MSTNDDHAHWLPRRDVARRLGVHKRTLIRWTTEGRLRVRRDERGRVFYAADDVERIEAERTACAAEDGIGGPASQAAETAALLPALASPPREAPGAVTLFALDVAELREALGGAEPSAALLVATLRSWGSKAAAFDELSDALGGEPDADEMIEARKALAALHELAAEVRRGGARILRGEKLRRYEARVVQQLMAGDAVAVRVEQLRALGLLNANEETEEQAVIVWRRLGKLREELGAARCAALLAEMRCQAAQERLERLDALLRAANISGGVPAIEAALTDSLKGHERRA